MKTIICPICQSTSASPAWNYKDKIIWRCPMCTLEFTYPLQAAPLNYYQERYWQTAELLATAIHPGWHYLRNQIERCVKTYLPTAHGHAIDIGCGSGYFAAELKNIGFEVLGIDFNPAMIQLARDKYKIPARVARVETLLTSPERYEVALLIHVLEHVEDPLNLLKSIREILTPQGILLIELPNRERFSINRHLKKGQLGWHEYPPHHLTFWSSNSLRQALIYAGYRVLECKPRPISQEGQIGLFLHHRLRLPENWLIEHFEKTLRALGRILGLQGDVIFVAAQRVN